MHVLSILGLHMTLSVSGQPLRVSLSLSLHQGAEGKVPMLEKKLEEHLAENKPIALVLKQLIQALCAEEVGSL